MTEEFLHFIWKYRLYKSLELKTVTGEKITIIKPGLHNSNSGPDFFDARIKIDSELWAGNVEIHINSSSWEKHHHQNDPAYNNVILHVVYFDDSPVKNAHHRKIPTLELKGILDHSIFQRYSGLIKSNDWVPCYKQVSAIDEFIKINWLDRLTAERLERKANEIIVNLKSNKNNWEEVVYHRLAKNFGLKINSEPFLMLAQSLPAALLHKNKNSLFQMEALLYGQAGLLNQNQKTDKNKLRYDEYFNCLMREYDFLKKKYSLIPLDGFIWKFLRLRPAGFPTLRISQFANLIFKSTSLFSNMIEFKETTDIFGWLNVNASEYWNTHYNFGKETKFKIKTLGKDSINAIIINTIIPLLFAYGKQNGNSLFMERAVKFLEILPPEKNSITSRWQKLNFKNDSASSSQSLLELKNEYCNKKNCLSCAIGNHLLKN